jgi:hypothetical protein
MAIPRLVMLLLNDHDHDVRSFTVSAFAKLANHGEFIVASYPDVADAVMKSSSARKLGWPFRSSLRY